MPVKPARCGGRPMTRHGSPPRTKHDRKLEAITRGPRANMSRHSAENELSVRWRWIAAGEPRTPTGSETPRRKAGGYRIAPCVCSSRRRTSQLLPAPLEPCTSRRDCARREVDSDGTGGRRRVRGAPRAPRESRVRCPIRELPSQASEVCGGGGRARQSWQLRPSQYEGSTAIEQQRRCRSAPDVEDELRHGCGSDRAGRRLPPHGRAVLLAATAVQTSALGAAERAVVMMRCGGASAVGALQAAGIASRGRVSDRERERARQLATSW
jgi:hypothetical protein